MIIESGKNLPIDSEIMNFEQEDQTLSPGQYFSIFKMPGGRTPLESPYWETITSPSIVC